MTPGELAAMVAPSLSDGPIVVALGGGADSAVAAWLVAARPRVTGIFVRHALEGSAALEEAVERLAAHLGLTVRFVDAPVAPGPSLEGRARALRWAAIGESVAPGDTVVTGHTLDDQAETVLMNVIRGAGSAGVAAMEAGRPGIARPLLGVERAEVRRIAEELGLPFADDPANQQLGHLRNRVRRQLLPLLEHDYHPGARGALARAGTLAASDDALIEELASQVPVIPLAGAFAMPVPVLVTVSLPVASRAVRRGLRYLLAPYAGTRSDVAGVLAVAAGDASAANVSSGLVARREGPYVVVSGTASTPSGSARVRVPSTVAFGDTTVTFAATRTTPVHRHSTLFVDPQALGDAPVLRGPQSGDRVDLGSGTKPVRRLLSERGVPDRRRAAWPVVASGGRIVAVVGIRAAAWALPATSDAISIALERNVL